MNYLNIIFDVILVFCGAFWIINARFGEKFLSVFMGLGLLSIVGFDIASNCLGNILK